jgi:hypothetical protein
MTSIIIIREFERFNATSIPNLLQEPSLMFQIAFASYLEPSARWTLFFRLELGKLLYSIMERKEYASLDRRLFRTGLFAEIFQAEAKRFRDPQLSAWFDSMLVYFFEVADGNTIKHEHRNLRRSRQS